MSDTRPGPERRASVLTTEDAAFSPDRTAIRVDVLTSGFTAHFGRPGAVILRRDTRKDSHDSGAEDAEK